MRNCDMTLKGQILTITVDLSKEGVESSSGKSLVIGTTSGSISLADKPEIKVGLNVYTAK